MKITLRYLKLLIPVFTLLLIFTVIPPAFAADNAEAVPDGTYRHIDYAAPVPKRVLPVYGNKQSLPSSYDARDEGIVPAVRNQNPYGTCWAFAFTSAAEINLVKKGLASADGIDLSELQLIYYTYGRFYDPLGNLGSDEVMTVDVSPLERGGAHLYTALLANRWCGLADEEIMNYPGDIDFAMNSFDVDGIGRYIHFGDVYAKEYGTDFARAHLRSCYAISGSDVYGIKKAITEFGSVAGAMYASSSSKYYNDSNGAYYQNVQTLTDHAIDIIGWDDDFPVEAFSSRCRPSAPGAWLVRNSWGEDYGDGGYLWVSYEDASMTDDFYAFDFDSADRYDRNYQYDGGISLSSLTFAGAGSVGEAAIFTAESDEYISAVNFAPLEDTNVEYTVSVWVDPKDNNFVKKMPAAIKSGTTEFAGIYTVDLDKPVLVEAGHEFAVAVTVDSCADGVFSLFYDSDSSSGWLDSDVDNSGVKGYYFFDSSAAQDMSGFGAPRIKAFTTLAENEAPEYFEAELDGNTVSLFWDEAENADSYEIWAGTDNGDYELFAVTDETEYTFEASPENGVVLKYKVRALYGEEAGAFSYSRAVRFPVTVPLAGIEIEDLPSATPYYDIGLMGTPDSGDDEQPAGYVLEQYKTVKIDFTFTPENATDKLLAYLPDSNIVSVSADGTVTGIEPGYANIFINSRDGNFPYIVTVLVKEHTVHEWSDPKLTKEATCSAPGTLTFTCGVCKKTKTSDIAMTEHTPTVSFEAAAATCTENGRTREVICSVCRTVLEASETVNAAGHKMALIEKRVASCTSCGYELYRCENCDHSEMKNAEPMLTHNFILSETVSATCTEDGFELYVCEHCGDTRTDVTEKATGHADNDGDGLCDDCKEAVGGHSITINLVFLDRLLALFRKIIAFFKGMFNL